MRGHSLVLGCEKIRRLCLINIGLNTILSGYAGNTFTLLQAAKLSSKAFTMKGSPLSLLPLGLLLSVAQAQAAHEP